MVEESQLGQSLLDVFQLCRLWLKMAATVSKSAAPIEMDGNPGERWMEGFLDCGLRQEDYLVAAVCCGMSISSTSTPGHIGTKVPDLRTCLGS